MVKTTVIAILVIAAIIIITAIIINFVSSAVVPQKRGADKGVQAFTTGSAHSRRIKNAPHKEVIHMANNKYQLGIYNDYPLSTPFPQKVTLTHTEVITTIIKSDGSQMTRRETTKQVSYDPTPSNYKRLPKR